MVAFYMLLLQVFNEDGSRYGNHVKLEYAY